MRYNKEELKNKMRFLFEEESEQANDFLERYVEELVEAFKDIAFEDEDHFIDLFQEEIEKYDEYLEAN